jgi:hypothetical protein
VAVRLKNPLPLVTTTLPQTSPPKHCLNKQPITTKKMKKLILGICLCAGLGACHSNNQPKEGTADSQMMMGKSNQLGTANDSSHTAATTDSQAIGKKDGAPTDTTTKGSVKLNK